MEDPKIKLMGGADRGPVLVFRGSESAPDPNDIIFQSNNGEEMMRFCRNGDILVKGRFAENDKEIVSMFKAWLDRILNSH